MRWPHHVLYISNQMLDSRNAHLYAHDDRVCFLTGYNCHVYHLYAVQVEQGEYFAVRLWDCPLLLLWLFLMADKALSIVLESSATLSPFGHLFRFISMKPMRMLIDKPTFPYKTANVNQPPSQYTFTRSLIPTKQWCSGYSCQWLLVVELSARQQQSLSLPLVFEVT